ncbi:GDP-mannose 4,6-dehydratase [Desulfatitalea alkaliphila]|uniref:GDP-mannose 4,6-dehydratase n=1 Tax=Desulfatitalea alkaliphila TaxID=2929485 RepID=A0AA41R6T7_9BACT|nr:GDP-mannose 4,6-dehydratase [Desulfatitalea alkaliphila]MCJ8502473.1 GDP-mannose 4,6-dehydratase [Desulfatitalea alkaliphila]
MKRVLITGITGFTGHYVEVELAKHGWDVWGFCEHSGPSKTCYRHVDLTHAASVNEAVGYVGADAVVHLAAVSFVGHDKVDDFYRVNLMGTRNLLAALAAVEKKPECVILASSANVYGNSTEGVLSETTPPNPANDYALSKLAMEYMARLWFERLPIVITRPFNYTGVGQSKSFLLPKIVEHFRQRASVIELGNMDVWRDFSDVRAVATVYRRLLEVRPKGETVNICSGRTHSLRDVLSMAKRITGHKPGVEVNPAFVRANDVRSLCGDASKLRRLIGDWDSPPLEETLRWMLTEVDAY